MCFEVEAGSVSDAVVAFLPPTDPGAAAEYVAAPAELLAAAPRTVELADSDALPVADLAAVHDAAVAGRLTGKTVLIP
jgi:NADPH:quinone reductase-like Zn-dependent oxidoreductase